MLEVDKLSKSYQGPVNALHAVNFQADSGIFGLLGPNGAGKTTLMRILATLQLPDSGNVTLGELNLIDNPHEVRQQIGYLPQDMGAYPRGSGRERLTYLAGLKGIGPAREREQLVEHQLHQVNLADVADRRLDPYSGGMRQRVAMARTFALEPKILLGDEVFSQLDKITSQKLGADFHLFARQQKMTVILVTHQLEEAIQFGDRVVVMGNYAKVLLDVSIQGFKNKNEANALCEQIEHVMRQEDTPVSR